MQKFYLVSENVLFYLCLGLLIFIPLYPKFPLFGVSGTFAAVRMEDFLIAFTLILWLINRVISGKTKTLLKDKLTQTLLLFFFIGIISTISAIFLTHLVSPTLTILHYLRRVEFMLLLPLFASVIKTKKEVIWMLIALAAVTFLVNIYALGQQYLGWPVVSTTNSEFAKGQIIYLTQGARPNSTFAGHYDLAVFAMMAIVFLSALVWSFKSILYKAVVTILGCLSLVVLVLTAARVSFIAAIVGILASLFLSGKKLMILFVIAISVVVLLYPSPLRDRFISTITVNLQGAGERFTPITARQEERSKLNIPTLSVYNPLPKIKDPESTKTATLSSDIVPGEPIDPTELGVYRSFAIRLNIEWPRAIRSFLKNPLLGSGYSSMGLSTDNDFLRSLGEVGILGTVAFALVFIEVVKRLWSYYKSSDRLIKSFSIATLSMILAFLLNGLFIDVFEASKVASLFWMIVGLNLAAGKLK